MPTLPAQSDLVADFEAFLRYLDSKSPLPLTGAGELKSGDLWVLNERVHHKAPAYVTPKSRVVDYLLLGLLFQIATTGRLYTVGADKAG